MSTGSHTCLHIVTKRLKFEFQINILPVCTWYQVILALHDFMFWNIKSRDTFILPSNMNTMSQCIFNLVALHIYIFSIPYTMLLHVYHCGYSFKRETIIYFWKKTAYHSIYLFVCLFIHGSKFIISSFIIIICISAFTTHNMEGKRFFKGKFSKYIATFLDRCKCVSQWLLRMFLCQDFFKRFRRPTFVLLDAQSVLWKLLQLPLIAN